MMDLNEELRQAAIRRMNDQREGDYKKGYGKGYVDAALECSRLALREWSVARAAAKREKDSHLRYTLNVEAACGHRLHVESRELAVKHGATNGQMREGTR